MLSKHKDRTTALEKKRKKNPNKTTHCQSIQTSPSKGFLATGGDRAPGVPQRILAEGKQAVEDEDVPATLVGLGEEGAQDLAGWKYINHMNMDMWKG